MCALRSLSWRFGWDWSFQRISRSSFYSVNQDIDRKRVYTSETTEINPASRCNLLHLLFPDAARCTVERTLYLNYSRAPSAQTRKQTRQSKNSTLWSRGFRPFFGFMKAAGGRRVKRFSPGFYTHICITFISTAVLWNILAHQFLDAVGICPTNFVPRQK